MAEGPNEHGSDLATLARYWAPVMIWMVVIATMSGDPFSAQNTHRFIDPVFRYFFPDLSPEGFSIAHWWIRKAAHFSEFFVLSCLCFIALRHGRTPSWRLQWAAQALGIVAVFSLLDELHQMFVPTRGPSLVDSGIDTLGGFVAQLVLSGLYWKVGRVSRDPPVP